MCHTCIDSLPPWLALSVSSTPELRLRLLSKRGPVARRRPAQEQCAAMKKPALGRLDRIPDGYGGRYRA